MKKENHFINCLLTAMRFTFIAKKPLRGLILALLLVPTLSFAQGVAINTDDSEADPSAILDVKSSDKGFLLPLMTQTEIEAISNPANGLMVFSTTDDKFYVYIQSESTWKDFAFTPPPHPPWACGDPLTDDRDGQSYNTVQIGTQCWMAENLNIGTMISGSSNQTDNGTIEKYCYSNNTTNCDTYGGLYQWDEMMEYNTAPGSQGVCPIGWQLPTDDEYKTVEMQLGMTQTQADQEGYRGADEGGKLKESGTSHWNSPNIGATNSSTFTALPAGMASGSFQTLGVLAWFWTSNEAGSGAFMRALRHDMSQVYRAWGSTKITGYSVRCIKD